MKGLLILLVLLGLLMFALIVATATPNDKDEYGDCWKVVFKSDETEDIPDEKPEE